MHECNIRVFVAKVTKYNVALNDERRGIRLNIQTQEHKLHKRHIANTFRTLVYLCDYTSRKRISKTRNACCCTIWQIKNLYGISL